MKLREMKNRIVQKQRLRDKAIWWWFRLSQTVWGGFSPCYNRFRYLMLIVLLLAMSQTTRRGVHMIYIISCLQEQGEGAHWRLQGQYNVTSLRILHFSIESKSLRHVLFLCISWMWGCNCSCNRLERPRPWWWRSKMTTCKLSILDQVDVTTSKQAIDMPLFSSLPR